LIQNFYIFKHKIWFCIQVDDHRDKVGPSRRHYATTEEKIQQEFREMQKREEELK
jgi:hypothetical protein